MDNPAFHDAAGVPSVHFISVPPTPVKKKATTGESRLKKGPLLRMWRLRVTKGGRRDRRATALLCVLVTAVVLLLATVAVVLYLTVGGGLARLSGKKQTEATQRVDNQVEGSFRILNRHFEEAMSERGSAQFARLSSDVIAQVDRLFKQSSVAEEYSATEVTAIRNGSVIVEFVVHLQNEVAEAAKKVGMAFERGLVNEQRGQIRLGDFLVDFPSIRFKVPSSSPGAEPFEGHDNSLPESFAPDLTGFPMTPTTPSSTDSSTSTTTTEQERTTSTPPSTVGTTRLVPTTRAPPPPTAPSTTTVAAITTPRPTTAFTRWLGFPPGTRFPTPPPLTSIPILSPERYFPPPRRPFPGAGYSPRTAADLLVQWSEWSAWSECDVKACSGNQTKIRTRECRTKNGTGPRLNDTRLCTLLGGVDTEIKECPCSGTIAFGLNRGSESFTLTSNTSPPPRLCNECLPSEVCVALHVESFPICRPPKDPKDVLACRGWCDPNVEYCQHLGNNSYRCVDDRLCLPDEWRCKDGLCVPKEKRCDGHFNCYDMTDEYDCDCGPGYFHCGNNTSCVPNSKRCDGEIDCWDGTDEANCTKPCDPEFMACNSGGCIPIIRFCDGFTDCTDASDEPDGCREDPCTSTEFQCTNHRCVPLLAKCDTYDQCGDGSDEANCNVTYDSVLVQVACLNDQFQCSSGMCIGNESVCDGIPDCADLSDEVSCSNQTASPPENFECPPSTILCENTSTCVARSQLCDGTPDCENGWDEGRCTKYVVELCTKSDFKCANGRCVSRDDLCDTVNDCGDFSDERECTYHPHYDTEDSYFANNNQSDPTVTLQLLEDEETWFLNTTTFPDNEADRTNSPPLQKIHHATNKYEDTLVNSSLPYVSTVTPSANTTANSNL